MTTTFMSRPATVWCTVLKTDMQAFRGLHYDLARGNRDSLSSLRRLILYCSACGLNELVLYIEDLWGYRRHPQLARSAAYRLEDMWELADYARCHGMDLVPSLTTLGHSAHILNKPGYGHLAFPGAQADFDVLNPAVYELFEGLLDEVLPGFSSPYVFINGDEVKHVALNPAARKAARKDGIGSLYKRGMARLAQLVIDRGRRPILWHDMLLHHPDSLVRIPRKTIVAYWYYDYQAQYPAIAYFREQGYDTIAAPGLLGKPRQPMYARALPNIQGQAEAAWAEMTPSAGCAGQGVCLGTMTTVWEQVAWPAAALAIYATGRLTRVPSVSLKCVLDEFPRDVFGLRNSGLGSAWREFSRQWAVCDLLAKAQTGSRAPHEQSALAQELDRRKRRIRHYAAVMREGHPRTHRDFFRRISGFARDADFAPGAGRCRPADPDTRLYASAIAHGGGCCCIEIQTRYGHKALVISNGRLAVTILPEFGAAMIEWVLLDQPTFSYVRSQYDEWAAASPRVPGDPGLGSPWGAVNVRGWRETIFFNARLAPSSLWGRPFTTRVRRQTTGQVAIECCGANEVAEVRRVITLRRGRPALDIDVIARNRSGDGWLAVMPNALHRLPDACAPLLRLAETGDGKIRRRALVDHDGRQMFAPRGDTVRVESPAGARFVQMTITAGEVSHVLTDVGSEDFTLEPLGTIRRCAVGESVHMGLRYEIG